MASLCRHVVLPTRAARSRASTRASIVATVMHATVAVAAAAPPVITAATTARATGGHPTGSVVYVTTAAMMYAPAAARARRRHCCCCVPSLFQHLMPSLRCARTLRRVARLRRLQLPLHLSDVALSAAHHPSREQSREAVSSLRSAASGVGSGSGTSLRWALATSRGEAGAACCEIGVSPQRLCSLHTASHTVPHTTAYNTGCTPRGVSNCSAHGGGSGRAATAPLSLPRLLVRVDAAAQGSAGRLCAAPVGAGRADDRLLLAPHLVRAEAVVRIDSPCHDGQPVVLPGPHFLLSHVGHRGDGLGSWLAAAAAAAAAAAVAAAAAAAATAWSAGYGVPGRAWLHLRL
eukprot:scaffold35936_cov33-Phaeocystis_antarctica.AAC.4